MCFEECPVCAILNVNWKLPQNKSNIVHSLKRLRTVSEQIDRDIAMQFLR